ncbi:MAG TPA: hypothetical protein VK436_02160 [Methanocella sp.]|nr:hypothetical protein [Methanocella sp.]
MIRKIISGLVIATGIAIVVVVIGIFALYLWIDNGTATKIIHELQPTPYVTTLPAPSATSEDTAGGDSAASSNNEAEAGNISGEMVGHGTDSDTYNRGDTAKCYVEVKNTGDATINRVIVDVDVYKSVWGVMIKAIDNQSYVKDDQNIAPGETGRVEIAIPIPDEYDGMSTTGDYRFDVSVIVGDRKIGSFSEKVKVT